MRAMRDPTWQGVSAASDHSWRGVTAQSRGKQNRKNNWKRIMNRPTIGVACPKWEAAGLWCIHPNPSKHSSQDSHGFNHGSVKNYLECISVSHPMRSLDSWWSSWWIHSWNRCMQSALKHSHADEWFWFRAIMKAHVINHRCWMLANHPRWFSRFPCGIPRDNQ